jgi:hypothetical protein
MSDGLTQEQREEAWETSKDAISLYWTKIDAVLDNAISKATDPKLINELQSLKGAP